jgi:hypothetical protein
VKGRYGWLLVIGVVVVWDVVAVASNGQSLTGTFRRSVAETAWRWPALIVIVALVAHLYMPVRLRKYDPLDRLYRRAETTLNPKTPRKSPPVQTSPPRQTPFSGPTGPLR